MGGQQIIERSFAPTTLPKLDWLSFYHPDFSEPASKPPSEPAPRFGVALG
jgi:hypothetical protein